MDQFTLTRMSRFLSHFKQEHGRDASQAELEAQGFAPAQLDEAVRKGMVDKYQVTTSSGARENRYKLHRDWRTLRHP